ncbi:MAG: DUF3320 domain-containing protein [Fimbriimonas sp.]|nr:DUF3320 domain-containing protein [Fimbriimonas sp.]
MAVSTPGPEGVRAQVEALRRKLLDLSLRNRMLNYRPSKRLGIAIVGEDTTQLYRMLVDEGKKMSFVGRPDLPKIKGDQPVLTEISDHGDAVSLSMHRQAAEEEMDAFLGSPVLPLSQTDTKLNTADPESLLQTKLSYLMRETSLATEELGINTLFLTLGCLEWSESAERSFRAPILYVPVTLERQGNGAIKLAHDGSDIGTNLPLQAKMREFNLSLPGFDDEKPLLDYFAEIEATIRLRPDWRVHRDEVHLAFFNYEKYSMYVDLGGDAWGPDAKPWHNADIAAMLGGGYGPAESRVDESTQLDMARPLDRSFEVYDADSSQIIAMIRAAEGHSIVVEGPPGTGKSQTITNIIAEAVAQGKTVLFVSAKRAALEVVKRRLEEADLGGMCLDLHNKVASRKGFYQEIKRTVERSLAVRREDEKLTRLGELRNRLNAHCAAVHDPVDPYGMTPFEAMSLLGRLPQETVEDRRGRIPFEQIKHWTQADLATLMPLTQALQGRLAPIGMPKDHAFWGATIRIIDPATRLDLTEGIALSLTTFTSAQMAIREAAAALRIDPPSTPTDVSILRQVTEQALAAPEHGGVAVRSDVWRREQPAIEEAIEALRQRKAIRTRRSAQVTPEIWNSDLSAIATEFDLHAEKWFRGLVGPFRRASTELDRYLSPSGRSAAKGRKGIIHDVRDAQDAEARIARADSCMSSLFGVQWKGNDSDADILDRLLHWILELQDKVESRALPAGILDLLSGNVVGQELLALAGKAEIATEAAISAYQDCAKTLGYPSDDCRQQPIEGLVERVSRWQSELPTLPQFIYFNEARNHALAAGLAPVVEIADEWPLASTRLADTFQRSYATGVVREAMQSRPALGSFERMGHEVAIAEFRLLDDFKLKFNRAAVRLMHQRRMPSFDLQVGNLNLLRIQCELQRSHKPIRWTLERAGEAVQKIKPVFMMSPLSVAIHLPPELPPFDMVIFDEASQVKPEDALCAIARAKQTIVVGDTRQMPPTSFFDRLADDEEFEEEEEFTELGAEARKLESILSLMSAVAIGSNRRPELRWHYRSIHPELIQPSNEMFYDNRLIVFPSASALHEGRQIGLVFHHLPGSVYESGSSKRFNRIEAESVAQAVWDHIRTDPDDSLLVAAMNKPQADLIYDEVQKLERQDPAPFHAFRLKHPHEPLSIKNLENVQGDERDVVLISITYGRDSSGVIRRQFGPLLKDGGERRLNVLISRARKRCEVFSNMTADDLRSDLPRPGVDALKRYLKFAQTGQIDVPMVTGHKAESPFEEEVAAELAKRDYEFDLQVGSEGFRIDLAVIDTEEPGRYRLGVECDGATYHSARSARDRDKLRQRILEARGWRLHRIWSHDWWQDRTGEIERLVQAIEQARTDQQPPRLSVPLEAPDIYVEETQRDPNPTRFLRPYTETPRVGPLASKTELEQYMIEVVKTEGPIHEDLLRLRIRDAAGYDRTTKTVRALVDGVIKSGSRWVRHSVDCYVEDESQFRQPRDWSTRPSGERKVEYVSEVEIASALRFVVGNAFGIDEPAAAKSALNLLGFKRITDSGLARGLTVVQRMITAGGIKQVDGLLYRP